MNHTKLDAILEELSAACRESQVLFCASADKAADNEFGQYLSYRARRYEENDAELMSLRKNYGEYDCEGPELNASPRYTWTGLRRRIANAGWRNLLQTCEAEDGRMLMLYRDSLEYELPKEVAQRLSRQFAELIEQHVRLQRLQDGGARAASPVLSSARNAEQPAF